MGQMAHGRFVGPQMHLSTTFLEEKSKFKYLKARTFEELNKIVTINLKNLMNLTDSFGYILSDSGYIDHTEQNLKVFTIEIFIIKVMTIQIINNDLKLLMLMIKIFLMTR